MSYWSATSAGSNITYTFSHSFLYVVFILAVWSVIWKGLALWRAGQNKDKAWFIILLILNTVGILEIIYLIFFSKKNVKGKR
jgi:methionyl-tRNA synthetase